jgi:hypothetical protein
LGFETILETRCCMQTAGLLNSLTMILLHLYALFTFKYSESRTHIRNALEI